MNTSNYLKRSLRWLNVALFVLLFIRTSGTVYTVVNLKNDGVGSLRYAAGQLSPGDTIMFDPGLIAGGSDSIVLEDEISINHGCVIIGLQTANDTLFISGGDSTQVFSFELKFYSGGERNVTLDHVSIRNGKGSHGAGVLVNATDTFFLINSSVTDCNGQIGGGVYVGNTSLIMRKSRIHNNHASVSSGGLYCFDDQTKGRMWLVEDSEITSNVSTLGGGGIGSFDTKLEVRSSIIGHNKSGSFGGGILAGGITGPSATTAQLYVYDCILEWNEATIDGGGAYVGSRSRVHSISAVAEFDKTSIVHNRCGGLGGGLFSNADISSTSQNLTAGAQISMKISRSTFAYNEATTGGGGLACKASYRSSNPPTSIYRLGTELVVEYSTFYQNRSMYDDPTSSWGGQNLFVYTRAHRYARSQFHLKSSIVFGEKTNIFHNYSPRFVSQGHNVFSDTVVPEHIASDLVGVDSTCLDLGPLQVNGGNTPTMLPSSKSVAVENGYPYDTMEAQNTRIYGERRDVGAAETTYEPEHRSIWGCDSVFYKNRWYADSRFVRDTLKGDCGFDSIVPVHLWVLSTHDYDTIEACDSFTWTNGVTYTSDVRVRDTLLNSNGCDSIIELSLTINRSKKTIDTITACDSFTWTNGVTYKSSGTYSNQLSTSEGCDSLSQLELIVNKSISALDVFKACDSLTWINGTIYYSSTDTPTMLLTNQYGCDSLVQLNVSIVRSTRDTVLLEACDSIKWSNGLTYYEGNHFVSETFQTKEGCDSTVVAKLNITSIDTTIRISGGQLISNEMDGDYQWINCDSMSNIPSSNSRRFNPGQQGGYAVRISKSGCVDTSRCFHYGDDTCCSGVSIVAFPNPFVEDLKVRVYGLEKGVSFEVSVYNAIGQLVARKSGEASREVTIQTYHWASGVYVAKVSYGSRVKGFKLIHWKPN